MAKKEAAPAPKMKSEGPARRKRNTFQRKCLSRASKFMFANAPRSVRRALVGFEQANKARTAG